MKKSMMYVFIVALAACFSVEASITNYTNTFSDAGDITAWVSTGTSTTVISHFGYIQDFDDGDPTQILSYTSGMTITGDGLLSDGSMMIDLQNAVVGDEAASYTLSGTLDLGEIITFSGTIGAGSSYAQFDAQIWNVTDNILLAETPSGSDRVISQAHNVLGVPVDFTLSYTGLASDVGDIIQVRINDNGAWGGSTGRNIYMDNVMITAIPNSALPITGFTNTFSNAEDITAWVSAGSAATVINHYTGYPQDFDDGDPTQILAYTNGMTITGDGVRNDGTLRVETQNAIAGDEAAGYMLSGALAEGEEITFSGTVGAGSAYAQFDAQIWNVTDNSLLAETPSGSDRVFSQAHHIAGVPVGFSLSYTGLVSDAGDVIQVRINDNGAWDSSTARHLFVDNVVVTITSAPLATYDAWLDNYPSLGANTNLTDNPDGDALDNLYEYALGGNPTNSSDVGLQSTYENLGNQIEYVYHMRSDAVARGLTYEMQVDEDLIAAPVWTNLGVTVTGTNVGAVVNGMGSFDIVTNQVPIDVDAKFIRLNIEQQ